MEQDLCIVLIYSYYINSMGSNMQVQCWNYYLFDLLLSDSLEIQAIRCILYLGQQSIVKMYSYIITDSFNVKQLIKNIEKALPEITTQLNMSLFSSALENINVSLSCWIWNGDYLISYIIDELADLLSKNILLKDNNLITALFYNAKNGTVIYNSPSNYKASSWFSVIYF